MHKILSLSMLTAALAVSCAAQPAFASPPNEYASVPGASCDVAGINGGNPNNMFDKRATGSSNDSASLGVFVICPFQLTPTPMEGGVVKEMNLSAYTIDGSTRNMACTLVIGSLVRYVNPIYVTKTFAVNGAGAVVTWNAADFGGTAGDGIPGSAWGTITCNVPPQVSINLMYAKLNDRIE